MTHKKTIYLSKRKGIYFHREFVIIESWAGPATDQFRRAILSGSQPLGG
jgi:hypothetical protein